MNDLSYTYHIEFPVKYSNRFVTWLAKTFGSKSLYILDCSSKDDLGVMTRVSFFRGKYYVISPEVVDGS